MPQRISSSLGLGFRERSAVEHIIIPVQRAHIVRVLDECDWTVKGPGNAAERLGLNESTLRSRMKKLYIERPPRLGGDFAPAASRRATHGLAPRHRSAGSGRLSSIFSLA